MSPRFPQEIFELFIESAFDDFHLLGKCGLVCRNWLPTSRSHLFREVKLTEHNKTSWLEILNSPAETFRKFVVHIHVDPTDNPQARSQFSTFASCFPRTRLPGARILSLQNINVNYDIEKFDRSIGLALPFLRRVAVLNLISVTVPFHFISLFTSLRALKLQNVPRMGGASDISTIYHQPPLSISRLNIQLSTFDILRWIMMSPTKLSLTHLSLGSVSQAQVHFSTVGRWLDHFSGNNEKLSIGLGASQPNTVTDQLQNFMLRIQKLRLSSFEFFLSSKYLTSDPWFLQSVATLNLDTLVVRLRITKSVALDLTNLALLDSFGLASSPLKEIRCIFPPVNNSDEISLRLTLPKCSERGILRITSSS
ncbi:hypothetical protein C8J56DRAFT_912184 [Mycena floridula]|nr:hypothetical protein C8J56DRAFT_912184 [Mycena floridula]